MSCAANWLAEITKLTIPSALYDTACAIAQALDTDSGGAASWGVYSEEVTPYSTEGTFGRDPDLLTQLFSDATQLHEFVSAEYAARFTDQTPPTLQECEAFRTVLWRWRLSP